MPRTNVYEYPDPDTEEGFYSVPAIAGWFDPDRAEVFHEDTFWNGTNNVSVHTRDPFTHHILYRTASGRWVLHRWSQWQGSQPTYEFISDDAARLWLIANHSDTAVETYFGPLEPERGPGRPEIGPEVKIRLTPQQLAAIDSQAAATQTSRAETIRSLIATALSARVGTITT